LDIQAVLVVRGDHSAPEMPTMEVLMPLVEMVLVCGEVVEVVLVE